MSLLSQQLFSIASSRVIFYFSTPIYPSFQNPNFSPLFLSRHLTTSLLSQNFCCKPQNPFNFALKPNNFLLKVYRSDGAIQTPSFDGFNFDSFLSVAELLCILSSAVVTISYALKCTVLSSKKMVLGVIGSQKAFAWGLVVMMSGVMIGAWIRRRQWLRFCRVTVRNGRESVDLVERIEKLEEDLRSSATLIRVLSRQLEKLGIRFRVTRKALKEPIAETAALAKKNSEATRSLAMHEDMLEKELGEIQKVLLAMQEQQQKQLKLILAIGKNGRLWEIKKEPGLGQDTIQASNLAKGENPLETHGNRASGRSEGTDNNESQASGVSNGTENNKP